MAQEHGASRGGCVGAAARLQQYGWPGNVRELRNVIERVNIMVGGDTITAQDLGFLGRDGVPDVPGQAGPVAPLSEARDRFEKDYILRTLAAQHGNMSRTAEVLGVERSNRYKKLRVGIRLGVGPKLVLEDLRPAATFELQVELDRLLPRRSRHQPTISLSRTFTP